MHTSRQPKGENSGGLGLFDGGLSTTVGLKLFIEDLDEQIEVGHGFFNHVRVLGKGASM